MHVLKDRWWPLPGVLAVIGTVILVGLSQGWVFTSSVVMQRNVQVGAPPTQPHATTTSTTVPPEDGVVVGTARPVLGEGAAEPQAARSPAPTAPDGSQVPAANPGPAANDVASSNDPVTTTTVIEPPTTSLSPTTTTTQPWSTTSTTDDGLIDH